MVKTVELSLLVPGVTAQALFDTAYGAPCLRSFHLQLNRDPAPIIGEWVDDSRTVSFNAPVDAPAFIKRLVGKDVMRVEEAQRRAVAADGAISLTSVPAIDMPGGAKFATKAVLTFSNTTSHSLYSGASADGAAAAADGGDDDPGGGGCQVSAVVACSASGPYGLISTIEGFMAEAAKKSLQEFLDFVVAYLQEQAPEAAVAAAVAAVPQPGAAAAPAIPPAAELAAAAEAAEAAEALGQAAAVAAGAGAGAGTALVPEWAAVAAEHFYDATDLPLPSSAAAAVAAGAAGRLPPPPLVPGSGEGLHLDDAALLYLHYLCRTGDQTVGLLQALEHQVRQLQQQVTQLQAAAEEQRRQQRWLPDIPDTVSTRQALLAAALLAGTSAAAVLLWSRRRQQCQ